VRELLEQHLDVSQDPSLAIRSVYGQWFPWLLLIDSAWAAKQSANIFPIDDSLKDFFNAAWNAYIIYCDPYNNVFEVLQRQYALAVERLQASRTGQSIYDSEMRLAEQLMTFYWRGRLDAEENKTTLINFWKKASPEVRGNAIEHIGRSLYNYKKTFPPVILERLKSLWEERLTIAKTSTAPESHKYEMREFGWWFASNAFEDNWTIEQLLEALRIGGKIELEDEVLKTLDDLVQSMPNKIIECLELMVKGDREGWGIYGWRDQANSILTKALKTDAASAAEDFIHYLGSRGYLEFRELLKIKAQ
jgi:hypothetical protein